MQREEVDKWLTRVLKVINHNPVCHGTSLLRPCVRVKVDGKAAALNAWLDPSVPVSFLGWETDARGQCQRKRALHYAANGVNGVPG